MPRALSPTVDRRGSRADRARRRFSADTTPHSHSHSPLAGMRIEHEIVTLRTVHPFIIARGGSSEWRTVWVRITDRDGTEGWGEAAPSRFYGETADTVVAVLGRFAPLLEGADAWSL